MSAAAACFVEFGLRGTTMEVIARRAGAGKATLYRYFDNKDDVIDALVDREVDRLVARLEQAAGTEGPAPDRLDAAFVAGVGFLANHPVLVRGREEDPAELLARLTARRGAFVERCRRVFADIVAAGVAEQTLRPVAAEVAAEAVLRLLLSWFAFPELGPRRGNEPAVLEFARTFVSGGLVVRPLD